MIKLCLMASHGYPPGLILQQEQGLSRVVKDCRPYLVSPATRRELPSVSFNPRLNQFDGSWKPIDSLCVSNQLVEADSSLRGEPVVIDVQDRRPDSILFSFGIAQQCAKQEKVSKFLASGASDLDRGGLDLSLLGEVAGLQDLKLDAYRQPHHPSLIYLASGNPEIPLVDFVADMSQSSKIKFHPNGKVLFVGSRAELNDILSVVAEFYLSRHSKRCRKLSSLVPQFKKLDEELCTTINVSPARFEAVTVAPLKSPEKVKLKPSPKRKNSRKGAPGIDLYKRNYFHAWESLLSLMTNSNHQQRKTAILSLKKSVPELPDLLSQLSAGIAGTGLAVLFSVMYKVASGVIPFSAAKLLNTGLGLGLLWLSWAVNKLGDIIIYVSKNASKSSLREDEMIGKIETSIKEVYLRAATVMAVAVLRLA